jgi:proline-specific peptidase
MQIEEGYIPIDGYKVWYRSVGQGGIPLLCLHGGPGAGHDYLESLEALAAVRQVVFYDQLGCGKSDIPDDTSLWHIARSVAEVESVRKALGLDRIHLLGQSWGGWLSIEYMLSRPSGIVSLVLASTSASIPQFVAEVEVLKAQLPPEMYATMRRCEAAGDYDNPDYLAAVDLFYHRHLCRLDPWPDAMLRSAKNLDNNPVYLTINGPNEFVVIGNLKDWDRRDRLGEIKVPTLVTVGGHDELPLPLARTIQQGIAGAELHIFERSGHVAHLEEAPAYMAVVADFHARVEARAN